MNFRYGSFFIVAMSMVSVAQGAHLVSGPNVVVYRSSATVTWQTDIPTDTWLMWNTSGGNWDSSAYDPAMTTDHTATAINLLPTGLIHQYLGSVNGYWIAPLAKSEQIDEAVTSIGCPPEVCVTFPTPDPDLTSPTSYYFRIWGGQHIVQGYSTYLELDYSVLNGVWPGTDGLGFSLTWDPLPAGITLTSARLTSPNQVTLINPVGIASVYLTATQNVRADQYDLIFHATYNGMVQDIHVPFTVDPVPPPLPRAPIMSVPPIPSLATWQYVMTVDTISFGLYGGYHWCHDVTYPPSSEGFQQDVWYYDGIRVYEQIAAYTHDPSWYACSDIVNADYGDWVTALQGGVQPFTNFSQGFYLRYQRKGNPSDKQNIVYLANEWMGYDGYFGSADSIREQSYALETQVFAAKVGSFGNPIPIRNYLDALLGYCDELFVSHTYTYHRPWMAGLMMESLINYYTRYDPDPRIPPAVQKAADWMWQNMTIDAGLDAQGKPLGTALRFDDGPEYFQAATVVDPLIAPAYAWLWAMTGDPKYQQEGDLLFNSSINGTWFGAGKEFSQMYRWTFDYVTWRQHPEIVITNPPDNPPPVTTGSLILPLHVYPNPWRADKHAGEGVTFAGLMAGVTVKLFTVSGHQVKTLRATGPSVVWDMTDNAGDKVASGIYVYLITGDQGKKVNGKLAVLK